MLPPWLGRPMWDESRALTAFDPARFAFAIVAVAAWLPWPFTPHWQCCARRLHSIEPGEW
jgi:hypothetical protein